MPKIVKRRRKKVVAKKEETEEPEDNVVTELDVETTLDLAKEEDNETSPLEELRKIAEGRGQSVYQSIRHARVRCKC